MTDDARYRLRDATQAAHARVDAAFAVFDLGDRRAYTANLSIQARVVPMLERAVADTAWSGFVPRGPLLAADLAELGQPLPASLADPKSLSEAASWGVQYVLEGSRLGGAMLARTVAPGLPARYLGAAHADGSWRAFQAELNHAAKVTLQDGWDDAVDAALGAFAMFERAVQLELESLSER